MRDLASSILLTKRQISLATMLAPRAEWWRKSASRSTGTSSGGQHNALLIRDVCPGFLVNVRDCSRKNARKLWPKIPKAYRQSATVYTDRYGVDTGVIPAAQHQAISKFARTTNPIERFNNTLRPCVSRLLRSALSFSKALGVITYVIWPLHPDESDAVAPAYMDYTTQFVAYWPYGQA